MTIVEKKRDVLPRLHIIAAWIVIYSVILVTLCLIALLMIRLGLIPNNIYVGSAMLAIAAAIVRLISRRLNIRFEG